MASSNRQDIVQATSTFESIREKLFYKDKDSLDAGMVKVEPLEHLDEEVYTLRDMIESSVAEADRVHDGVPSRVLSQVNWVIQEAKKGRTTLFQASFLLEVASEVFQYARRCALDRFDLSRACVQVLREHDDIYAHMLEDRISTRMDVAEARQTECIKCVENAVVEADRDVEAHKRRVLLEEEACGQMGGVREVETTVRETINNEMGELEMIKDNCRVDLDAIVLGMRNFQAAMDQASANYRRQDKEMNRKLQTNQQEQENLRSRLQKLQEDEENLKKNIKEGREQEDFAAIAREDTREQVGVWQSKIEDLQERVKTSITIMTEMKNVTDTILTDAKERQQKMREKLQRLEVECLLAKRDAIMAEGVLCMLIRSDCLTNIAASQSELEVQEKEKKYAAKTGLNSKVRVAKEKIDEYNQVKARFEAQKKDNEEKLEDIRQTLGQVDTSLRTLRPSLKLDSLNDRYTERNRLKEQAFEQDSLQGIQFSSRKAYKTT